MPDREAMTHLKKPPENKTETEKTIIASAEKLFYLRGKAGTSMQDIADDAGINRTLLNYYFRTKDQLFEAVFRNALSSFVPSLVEVMRSDQSLDAYVHQLIETVITAMLEKPQIPSFVLHELSSNPQRMPQIMREMGVDPGYAIEKMHGEGVGEVFLEPRQLIINLLSLCVFPFAARPVIVEILYGGDQEAYVAAMEERKILLPALVGQFIGMSKKQGNEQQPPTP
ncbi:MAG: TetR family transcriptional regulator [Bacteroidales bacterium]